MRILRFVVQQLVGLLKIVTYEWAIGAYEMVRRLIAALLALWKRRGLPHDQRHPEQECLRVRHPSLLRPDPTIYSQVYLMKLGLPVTWDNPDIRLFRNGVPVDESEPLLAATEYEVEATLWNKSYDSPALGMPVEFSFLTFGVATTSTAIGTTVTDVGVKGSPSHPRHDQDLVDDTTGTGHYCLQVNLRPFDDANPENNLGQNNLNVALSQSPATLPTSLSAIRSTRSTRSGSRWTPTSRSSCRSARRSSGAPASLRSARIDRIVEQHRQHDFSVPAGWDVQLNPQSVSLAPNAEIDVEAVATPPAGFAGQQRLNVNAVADGIPIGGVSLIVQKA